MTQAPSNVTLPRELPPMDQPFRARIRGLFTVGETVLDGYLVDIYQLREEEFTLIDSGGAEGTAQLHAGVEGAARSGLGVMGHQGR